MKKFFTLLALVCLNCMGAWADVQETRVTDLATISSDKYYKIMHSDRGTLVVADGKNNMLLQGATVGGSVSDCMTAVTFDKSLWRIAKVGNFYTIQSCANNKYVGSSRNLSDVGIQLSIVSSGSNNEYYIKSGSNFLCFWPGYSWSATGSNDGPVAYKSSADGSNFQIYEVSDNEIEPTQSAINTAYSNSGKVGYPTMDALSKYANGGVNIFNCSTAKTSLNNVYALDNVALPEAGKAYRIYNVTKNGTKRVIYYDGTTLKITANGTTTVPDGKEGVFICGQDGAKFFFTNNNGTYFRVSSTDKNKVASSSYGEMVNSNNVNALTISKMETVNSCTDAQRFGLLMIKGYADFSGANGEHYLMGSNSSNFVQGAAGLQMFEDAAQSIGFLFEEVSFPYTTKTLNDGGDDKKYATVALPYAMNIPEGVKAYAASATGDVLHLTEVTTETSRDIPAGAYILVSENETSAAVLPAAANPAAVDNELQGSITTAPSGDIYVLNKVDDVGFYKFNGDYNLLLGKAYLPSTAKVSKFSFNFGEETTAISAMESERSNAEIYDLSGRKITRTQKGINIINGHKVIK